MSEQALEECLAGFHQSKHYTAALLIKQVLGRRRGLERGGEESQLEELIENKTMLSMFLFLQSEHLSACPYTSMCCECLSVCNRVNMCSHLSHTVYMVLGPEVTWRETRRGG